MNLLEKLHELAGFVGVWFDEDDSDIAGAFHFEPDAESVQVQVTPEVTEPLAETA